MLVTLTLLTSIANTVLRMFVTRLLFYRKNHFRQYRTQILTGKAYLKVNLSESANFIQVFLFVPLLLTRDTFKIHPSSKYTQSNSRTAYRSRVRVKGNSDSKK